MNVFELFAVLGLDTSQYDEGLKGAESSANSFGTTLSQGLGVAASVGAAALTATTAATVAGTKAFIDGVASTASYADSIDKLSQKMGFGVESFQEWQYIAQISGTNMESLKAGMKTLATAVETGSEAFDKLGLSQEQLASMSQEEVFEATITALQGVEDQSERTYLAGQLLGKGATELGPMLNLTAEEMDALKQEAHDLGGVLSEDQVKAGAAFQDSLLGMQTALDGLKNNMLSEFLPAFTTTMDGLALVFSGDTEEGLQLIEDGINELSDNISEVAPKFIQIGGSILTSLASSITKNLPVLLTSGAQAVSQIATGIVSELPSIVPAVLSVVEIIGGTLLDNASEILNAGLQIVLILADGLTQSLPTMVPSIASVVTEIVTTLTEPTMLSTLISAALQLILALGEGLIQAMPEITGLIPVYYVNIITTMIDMFPEILNSALTLIGDLGLAIFGAVGGMLGMSYDEVQSTLLAVFDLADKFGDDVINWFTGIFQTDLLGNVGTFFIDLYGNFTGGFDAVFGAVTGFGSDVMSTFTGTFDNVQETVSGAIDSLLDMFDFEWSLPEIKLPHFSVSGGEAPWGFGGQGSLPTVSIQWYKKAMNTPYLLDSATIFGAANGQYLGGGEAGTEMIYSHDKLMDDIGSAIDSRLSKIQIIAPIYIGGEKIDEVVVKSEQRNNYISGGR
jgi:hypothetical protein